MIRSSTTPDFWATYQKLPPEIKSRARRVYRLWRVNPRYPSLRFKKCGELWAIRISSEYRALALFQDDTFFWFWIGNHDDYERLLCEE